MVKERAMKRVSIKKGIRDILTYKTIISVIMIKPFKKWTERPVQ